MKNKEILFEMVRNNLKKLSKNQLIDQQIDTLWNEARPQLFNNLSQGVDLCIKHNISALEYYEFLDTSRDISKKAVKHRMNDVYYFLELDNHIKGV